MKKRTVIKLLIFFTLLFGCQDSLDKQAGKNEQNGITFTDYRGQPSDQRYAAINQLISNYSNQTIFCLNEGEEYIYYLPDGTSRTIRLGYIKYKQIYEYRDSVIGMMRRAYIKIYVNDGWIWLNCESYSSPVVYKDLKIMADTMYCFGNTHKTVQFSVWPADLPLLKNNDLVFPVKDYSLFSHETQGYNEVLHLGINDGETGGNLDYHNYGFDLGGFEKVTEVVSPVDGTVYDIWRPDGNVCSVTIEDRFGLIWDLCHITDIPGNIRIGGRVNAGQIIGKISRETYWSGNFSHLHFGVYISRQQLNNGELGTREINLYPWLIEMYQREYQKDLYAVAGPHQVARTGDTVGFRSHSVSWNSRVASYDWIFPDGTRLNGRNVRYTFNSPGIYAVEHWAEDANGNKDVDFCKVKVYDNPIEKLPPIYMTHTPNNDIRPNEHIYFQFWIQTENHTGDISVDFGDGTTDVCQSYSRLIHSYRLPGIYIVKASSIIPGSNIYIEQKMRVVVN